MTCAFIDQFSELVKDHVESIMPTLHRTYLMVEPSTPDGCLIGNFESSFLLIPKVHINTHLCDFEGMNGISSPSFVCTSPTKTSISMDTSEDVRFSMTPRFL